MGDRHEARSQMAWQGTLGQMRDHGTRLAQTCTAEACRKWTELSVADLIAHYGPDYLLWDRKPTCAACGQPGHYMASPGPSTPFRPLRSGAAGDVRRAQFLHVFGFSKRDIARIKAHAETATQNYFPAALNDLDVPYRVGACMASDERHSNGEVLGSWAGRTLLYWPMVGAERDHWETRRPGPRKI